MANYYGWTSGSELYHYGIPGQKWGQRRFQNPDGSLTAEGRARYGRIAERHYAAGRALNKYASAHKGSKLGNLAAKAGKRQVQIGNSYRNSKSQNARDKKVQKALKVGAAVAGTALAAYGGYKLAQGIQRKKYGVPLTGMTKAARNQIKSQAKELNSLRKKATAYNTRKALANGTATFKDKARLAGWKARAGVHNAGVAARSAAKRAAGTAKTVGGKVKRSASILGYGVKTGVNNAIPKVKRSASILGYGVKTGAAKAKTNIGNAYQKTKTYIKNAPLRSRGRAYNKAMYGKSTTKAGLKRRGRLYNYAMYGTRR